MVIEYNEETESAIDYLRLNASFEVSVVDVTRFTTRYKSIKGILPNQDHYTVYAAGGEEGVAGKGGDEFRIIVKKPESGVSSVKSMLENGLPGLVPLGEATDGSWRKGNNDLFWDLLEIGFDIGRFSEGVPPHALPDTDVDCFLEGNHQSVTREIKTRSAQLIAKVKRVRPPVCEVCGFDYSDIYGGLGLGFIEAHHLIPLSSIESETEITEDDIALVCANCHRMLHRKDPLISPEELREVIKG